jgi:hypothetical protein
MGAPKPEFPPLLPFGFHPHTADELRKMLVEAFPNSTRRAWLWENFLELIEKLKAAHLPCKIWLDGSYLTQKLDPDDIDLIVEVGVEMFQAPTPQQDALLRSLARSDFHADPTKLHTFVIFNAPIVHVLGAQAAALRNQWINDWGYSLVKREPKGIALMEVQL